MATQYLQKSTKNVSQSATSLQKKSKKVDHNTTFEDNRPSSILQQKTIHLMENSSPIQRMPFNVIQLFSTPSTLRFEELKIGRAHNAGIKDEEVTLGTGLKFIQHFHCNGWDEQTKSFTSFTGTFNVGGTKYHYTIPDGGAGAWTQNPGKPPEGSFAMQMRTENKLDALTKAE